MKDNSMMWLCLVLIAALVSGLIGEYIQKTRAAKEAETCLCKCNK